MDTRAQRHALLFRRLAAECGGIDAITELKATRLGRTQLYRFQDPLSGCFAPADVIEDLELLCGKPIYSAAITDGLPSSILCRDLLVEACETSVCVADLMRLVMLAKAQPGGISPRARAGILKAVDQAAGELREVRLAAVEAATDDVSGVRRAS